MVSTWRYKRLWEFLIRQNPQHGRLPRPATRLPFGTGTPRDGAAARLGETPNSGGPLLAEWDEILAADSAAAALWNVWYYRHLNPALGRSLSEESEPPLGPLDTQTTLELLETQAGQAVAVTSLRDAWAATTELLGTDAGQWQWGDLHQIAFTHPLLDRADPALAEQMRIKPYPRGGSANTTNNTGFSANNFNVRSGASFRMVVDVGNWDARA